jgi:signal transduction histidine kinase
MTNNRLKIGFMGRILPNLAVIAQPILAFFMMVVLSTTASAQDFEPIDFDLPDGISIWQYGLLLFNLDEVVETVAFYAFLMAVLVIIFGLTIALRQFVWSAYTGLAVFGLLYIALNDQNVSGIHWSGLEITPRALLVVGHLMATANFVVAAFAIPHGTRLRRLKWPLFGMSVLSWPVWWIGTGVSIDQAKVIFNLFAGLSGLAHAIPFSRFRHVDGQLDRGLRLSALVIFLFLMGTVVVLSFDLGDEPVDVILASRLLIVAVIGFLVTFFIRRVFAVRRSRELIIQQTIQDAQREAEISRQLMEMERKHTETREIARLQKMRLATASHDIRQPIMSLRTTMDVLSQKQPPDVKAQLQQAFDYLDQLAGSYVEEARGEAPIRPEEDAPGTHHDGVERLSSELLCQSLDRMFADEAAQNGTPLLIRNEPVDMLVTPLALMRIVSNLITNAIKHSDGGSIDVDVRQDDGKAIVQVSNQGQLPPGDVFAAYAKGEASEGEGLGLAIVHEQASAHGYGLVHHARAGRVVFEVTVPATP